MIDESTPYPTGIYVDITPIDYAPKKQFLQKAKGTVADLLRFISYSVYWKQYKSKSLEEFMKNSEGTTYYRLRMITGSLFSFRSAEKWFQTFDHFIVGKESPFVTVAAGRKKYCGELFTKETFFPLHEAPFEGRTIYVYNHVDMYLKRLYGDYMKIPDPENREKHLCMRLDFNKSRGEMV